MFESQFRVVSIGIAAENKALESHILPVVPIEMFPLIDGEVMESLSEVDVSGADQRDVEYTVKIKTSSTLTCEWLPQGSNRVTSPDVRRGERLLIWQYGDSDKYYWTPLGMDDDLRRLETVIYAWSATPEIDAALNLTENLYSLEVSTHAKHLTLHTTQADGEPFEYTMQLNTAAGLFYITDQDGNSIQLDSANRIIKAINSDESEITIDKTKINAYAKDEIKARSDDHMEASAGGNLSIYVEGDVNQYVKGNYNIQIDGDKTEVVKGTAKEYYAGGQMTLSDAPIAIDGAGVDLQSGAAAGNASLSVSVPGSQGPGGGAANDSGEAFTSEELPPEYSLEATEPVRTSAGRYAAFDGPEEVKSTPIDYPEDKKPSNYTGEPQTVSAKTGGEKPTGEVSTTTTVGTDIDYNQLLGSTSFTIGDLSANALFSHQIKPQVGLTPQDIVSNMEALAEKILQPLKDQFGDFRINSGFRIGSGRSQHNKGQGVDIQGPSWSSAKYMEIAEWVADNLPCDQLIFEHGNSIWLHISFDRTKAAQRGQLLTMLNGNYEPGLKNYYA